MSLVLVVARPPRPTRALASVLETVRSSIGGGAEGGEDDASADAAAAPGVHAAADEAAADAAARTDVWRAVRDEVENLRELPEGAVTPGRLDALAKAIEEDAGDPTVSYAASAEEAIEAVRARI